MSLRTVEERFWSKVDKPGRPEHPFCWVWEACTTKNGYGRFGWGKGDVRYAHRVAYELLIETPPADLDIDHICRNRACVNPAHLEPVTRRENTLRGINPAAFNAKRRTCVNGHSFDDRNTRLSPNKRARHCIACNTERARKARSSKPKAPRKSLASTCGAGHAFDESNTYMRKDGGGRMCRACRADARRRYHERRAS